MQQRKPKRLTPISQADEIRDCLIRWIVTAHLPFTAVENGFLRSLLELLSPSLAPIIPSSGDTVKRWIFDEFEKQKAVIKRQLLDESKSLIHISFDLWTSPNSLAFMGVVSHYLARDYRVRTQLIALRRLTGSHSGENMAQCLIQVLQEYEIEDRLGYFVLDNAESNDICIDTVLREIRPDLNALDRSKRRLRCWGHILNLAAKAFLFGQDPDAFEIEAEMNQNLSHEEEDLQLWRKRGSVGKLHNVVVFGRRSPQRRELFESISLANDDGTNQSSNLMITQDNETRWNSTYLMITRALHLKREIEVFIDRCQLSPDPKKRVTAKYPPILCRDTAGIDNKSNAIWGSCL